MNDYQDYIIKELEDGGVPYEYDGILKNLHPTQTFFVLCCIDNSKKVLIELPPLSRKVVMQHDYGPVMENEYDFDIIAIYTEKPSEF